MQKLLIRGKKELLGEISISGSKNATLPILAASILAQKVKLTNIPLVKDIFTMVELLKFIGLKVKILKKKNIINMQKKKTGKLFGFCCESIAIIKGANSIKRKKLKEIGINIGLLFQIVDDLIDYKGDSTIVGKPTRSDEKKGKATLINLLGYKETINFAKNLKKKIDQQIRKYGTKANDLLDSVEFILKRKF